MAQPCTRDIYNKNCIPITKKRIPFSSITSSVATRKTSFLPPSSSTLLIQSIDPYHPEIKKTNENNAREAYSYVYAPRWSFSGIGSSLEGWFTKFAKVMPSGLITTYELGEDLLLSGGQNHPSGKTDPSFGVSRVQRLMIT